MSKIPTVLSKSIFFSKTSNSVSKSLQGSSSPVSSKSLNDTKRSSSFPLLCSVSESSSSSSIYSDCTTSFSTTLSSLKKSNSSNLTISSFNSHNRFSFQSLLSEEATPSKSNFSHSFPNHHIVSFDKNGLDCSEGVFLELSGPTRHNSIPNFQDCIIAQGGTDAKVSIPQHSSVNYVRKFQVGIAARELLIDGYDQLNLDQYFTEMQIHQLSMIGAPCLRVGIMLPENFIPNDAYSLIEIYDNAINNGIEPVVFQDLKKLSGEDASLFIQSSSKLINSKFALKLAEIFTENLKLIASNNTTIKDSNPDLIKDLLKISYRPLEKWQCACSMLSMNNFDQVTIDPQCYQLITGDSIEKDLTINPIDELNYIFDHYISKTGCPYFGYWMNGDSNISNMIFSKKSDGDLEIKIFDGKPTQKADWMVDISKCLFSLLGGVLIFSKEISLDNLDFSKLQKLRDFKSQLVAELDKNTFLMEADPNWEERASFFAISQFIRDCRVAYNNVESLEKKISHSDSEGFFIDDDSNFHEIQELNKKIVQEKNRIHANYVFAAALINQFKENYSLV